MICDREGKSADKISWQSCSCSGSRRKAGLLSPRLVSSLNPLRRMLTFTGTSPMGRTSYPTTLFPSGQEGLFIGAEQGSDADSYLL
jgi:hypothetical protein